MNLRIKLFNHFNAFFSVLFHATLFLIFLIIVNFNDGAVTIITILFMIDALPAIYLHHEYWEENYGVEIQILSDRLVYTKKNTSKTYNFDELQQIYLYKSKGFKFPFTSFESYYYAKIFSNNGEKIYITCLLTPYIEDAIQKIKGVPFEHKKRLYFNLV